MTTLAEDSGSQDGPHLILQDADGGETIVPLSGGAVGIGRRTSNDVQILDPTVSREHARVGYDSTGYWVEDLNSTHGTFVNDLRVRRQQLKHNDRIRLGKASNNTLIFRTHREFSDLIETAEQIEPTPENLRNLWALLEISKALNSSLRLDDVLEKVIEAVLALTRAERGMLLLGESADDLEPRVQRNFDTSDTEELQYSSSVVADVFTTGKPRILTDAAQDERFSGQESIVGLNLRTVMCVPLRLSHRISAAEADSDELEDAPDDRTMFVSLERSMPRGDSRMIGAIYVDRRSPTRFFTDQDLALFESFSNHAALAIDNASLYEEALEKRRLEHEIQVAREIQQSLLRHDFPELEWGEVWAHNRPSRSVGGDYYEIFESGEALRFAVGDVSGKGVPAALLMSTLQSSFLAESSANDDLARVCERVNDFLFKRTTQERYATFFVGRVGADRELTFVNAGHNPPLLLRDGEVHRLSGGGLPLGLFADRAYELQRHRLEAGDLLLCYTDGVTEANDLDGREFGEERLLEVIQANRGADARRLSEAIFDAIDAHGAGLPGYHDDITLIVLRMR